MNQNFSLAKFTRLALLLTTGSVIFAQSTESGQIAGRVTSGGKAIPQAKVLIRSPQLIGTRTAITDAEGNFRVPLLPPGDYTINVVADGYTPYASRQTTRLGLGAQIRLPLELRPTSAPSAVVEVVSSIGTLDKADPKVSVNYSAEALIELPTTNRTFEGAVDLAPGVVTGPSGVGSVSIRGGKGITAIYTLNGTTVGDDVNGASPNSGQRFLIDDSVEDTQVILSPLHGRYGRTGSGVINVATKSGSNEFEGSLRFYLTRNDWTALRPSGLGQTATGDDFYANRDIDVFLSGPIWKDKVWFAFSTVQAPTTSTPETITLGTNPSTWGLKWDPLAHNAVPLAWAGGQDPFSVNGSHKAIGLAAPFNTGASYTQSQSSKFYQGKLTMALNTDNTVQIERSYNNSKIQNATYAEFGITASLATTMVPDFSTNSFNSINWKSTLASNLFLEAMLSEKQFIHSNGPVTQWDHVRLYQSGQGGQIWPYGTNINSGPPQNNGNEAGSVNLKWFADWNGSHEVDFGVQYYESHHTTQGFTGAHQQRFYVYGDTNNPTLLAAAGITTPDVFGNQVGYLAANWGDIQSQSAGSSSGAAPMRRFYTGQDGVARTRDSAFYVTDVWQPNSHWTILGALRMDQYRVGDTNGTVPVKFWATPSPRVSVKYDLNGDSAHIFSGSLAKYTEGVSPAYTEQFIHFGSSDYLNQGWNANTPGQVRWVSYDQIINPANYGTAISTVVGSSLNQVDKNLSSPYIVELSFGYRRNRTNGSYVGINFVNKDWMNDLVITQDTSLAALTAFSNGGLNDGPIPSDWVVTGVNASGHTTYGLPRHFTNSSAIKRNYKAVELEFKEVVTSRLTFGGSYTWSRLTGNDNGGDSVGEPGFSNNANPAQLTTVSEYFGFRNTLLSQGYTANQISPYGLLVADQTHKARFYASYSLPVGKDGKVTFALLGRYDSGQTYSAQDGFSGQYNGTGYDASVLPASLSLPSWAPAQISGASWSPYSSGRGVFREPDTKQLDFTLSYTVPLVGKVNLTGKIDVTNVTNTNMLAKYNNYFSAYTPNPGAPSGIPVSDPTIYGTGNQSAGYADSKNYLYGRYYSASIGIKF